jgi:SagB-type dehydrogenase family enzyme
MFRKYMFSLIIFVIGVECMPLFGSTKNEEAGNMITLPEPNLSSNTSIEKAINSRRSIRSYKDIPLKLEEISQILWAAQGITDPQGLRSAPSAGALYPVEIYLLAGNVESLANGIYKYNPHKHSLALIEKGDKREKLCEAALNQSFLESAPALVIISAIYERTTIKYGDRGIRYVHLEAGHISQNIYLQAVSLDIGTVAVGAFQDEKVKNVLGSSKNEQPLYIMPIGKILE